MSLPSIISGATLPFVQEDFGWSAHQIVALLGQRRVAFQHLIPDAPQRVVGQEFDHVARREELVAEREFVAVARRLRFLRALSRSSFGVKYW